MEAETAASYVINLLNAIAFVTIQICRQSLKTGNAIDVKLKQNLKFAFMQFGNALPSPGIEEPAFRLSTEKLFSLHKDIPLAVRISHESNRILNTAVALIVFTSVAFVFGIVLPKEQVNIAIIIKLIVPVITLSIEAMLFYMSIKNDNDIDKLNRHLDSELENIERITTFD